MKTIRKHTAVLIGLLLVACMLILCLNICRVPSRPDNAGSESSRLPVVRPETNLQKTCVMLRPWRDKQESPVPPPPPAPRIEEPIQGAKKVADTSDPSDKKQTLGRQEDSKKDKPPVSAASRAELTTKPLREREAPAGRIEPPVKKVVYAGTAREVGKELLGAGGKQKGTIPLITMDYRRTLGWPGYVSEMLKLGGLFFVYDNHVQRIRAQIDVLHGKIITTAWDSLKGMSPRMREIKSELAAAGIMEEAQKTLGKSDYSLILLLPLNVDADIIGGIAQGLAAHNIDIQTVGQIIGEHELGGKGICFHVQQLVRRDGVAEPFDIVLTF
ncbi:MAG: hypothetical protein WC299_04685 [Kiritimatiellia bacterium]